MNCIRIYMVKYSYSNDRFVSSLFPRRNAKGKRKTKKEWPKEWNNESESNHLPRETNPKVFH